MPPMFSESRSNVFVCIFCSAGTRLGLSYALAHRFSPPTEQVLRNMRRGYTVESYMLIINRIREVG